MSPLRIGVLALQGDVREHVWMLERLGVEAILVRRPTQLDGLDGLVIPGGESTTIMRLMRTSGLDEAIASFPGPVLGTCAGMIVLDRDHLGLVDITVRRNAFGRQAASFETTLRLAGEHGPMHAVFIRAPWIEEAGPDVEPLAWVAGHPVAAREGRYIVVAFHPELSGETRFHELLCELAEEGVCVRA